jgi:hypothetical protein
MAIQLQGSPSLSEVGPIPAAESLFRALDDIKNRTLPFPGHIYDTAQQLSTLVENHKDALAVIESVVRPNNKDQNLFHFLCATNLTTLLDVNGRIKEAIEFKSAKCKMSKSLCANLMAFKSCSSCRCPLPSFSYMEGSRHVVNARTTRITKTRQCTT